jgi:hypothetical protein
VSRSNHSLQTRLIGTLSAGRVTGQARHQEAAIFRTVVLNDGRHCVLR